MANSRHELTGFLIVLKQAWDSQAKNPRYAGAGRVPPYHPEIVEDAAALDRYVFGGFKDSETNLMPTLDEAKELFREFSSSREYEIIFCASSADECARLGETFRGLGYDVVGMSGYWSILDDLSTNSWADEFRQLLNANGLFDERPIAERYLREYKQHDEPDSSFDFDVVYVARVTCDVGDTE